jgi:hypothetical protein
MSDAVGDIWWLQMCGRVWNIQLLSMSILSLDMLWGSMSVATPDIQMPWNNGAFGMTWLLEVHISKLY